MSLSIVIPSCNPEVLFLRRIADLCQRHPDWQVVVIDDASDTDLRDMLAPSANLTVHRQPRRTGAGAARNAGITAVRGTYTVFMDDDDDMDWDVVSDLMAMMDAQPGVDMAVSSYRFFRNGRIAPAHGTDRRIIDGILRGHVSRVVRIDGHEDLLRLTNFPWTKIYRSDFVRRIGLRFSETMVQNDIHAHWQSLLLAGDILVTGRVQCTQTVDRHSGRISDVSDDRRLQAYDALHDTCDLVQAMARPRVTAAFWHFYRDLVRWMLDVSSASVRPALMRRHVALTAMMPTGMTGTGTGPETGTIGWELWDMDHLTGMTGGVATGNVATGDVATDDVATGGATACHDICLTEISRLKHLAAALRADNDRLRGVCADQQRHLDSKAARMAFRLRRAYRIILPVRGAQR